MLKFIDTHNLSDLMLATNPNKASCVSVALDILTDIDKEKWFKKIMSDENALNGNKLITNRQYKTVLKTESYVKQNMSSCNLPLAIES